MACVAIAARFSRELSDNFFQRSGTEEERAPVRLICKTLRIGMLKFNRDVGKNNPAKFVERFEELAEIEGLSEREKLATFTMAMQGPAFTWVNTTDADTFRQLRAKFLNKYKIEIIQRKFRYCLLDGQYDFKNEFGILLSKVGHTCKILHSRGDKWIIDRMRSHFNDRIRVKLEAKEPQNITVFAEILAKLDRATYMASN